MKDPEYHTFDYTCPYSAHRHGGFLRFTKDCGRTMEVQYACPMDEIVKIGKPAIPYLLWSLANDGERMRVLSYDCIRQILGRGDLRYEVFAADVREMQKLLHEEGWLPQEPVPGSSRQTNAPKRPSSERPPSGAALNRVMD
jgi:hypothetical protein